MTIPQAQASQAEREGREEQLAVAVRLDAVPPPLGPIEIPQGPCCSFQAPGGQRLAIYELARPEVEQHFVGRRDF